MSKPERTSPKKFSEKIALLNKKGSEVTEAFERILKEVEETTRTRPSKFANQRRANYDPEMFYYESSINDNCRLYPSRYNCDHPDSSANIPAPNEGGRYYYEEANQQQQPQYYDYQTHLDEAYINHEPVQFSDIPSIHVSTIESESEQEAGYMACETQETHLVRRNSNSMVNADYNLGAGLNRQHQMSGSNSNLSPAASVADLSSLNFESADEVNCKLDLFVVRSDFVAERRMSTGQIYDTKRNSTNSTATGSNGNLRASFNNAHHMSQNSTYWVSQEISTEVGYSSLQHNYANQESFGDSSYTGQFNSNTSLNNNNYCQTSTEFVSAQAINKLDSNLLQPTARQQGYPLARSLSSSYGSENQPVESPRVVIHTNASFVRSSSFNDIGSHDYSCSNESCQDVHKIQHPNKSHWCQCYHCWQNNHYPDT